MLRLLAVAALVSAGCAHSDETIVSLQRAGMQGRHEMASRHDFATTLADLRRAVDDAGFKTFAVIDHAAGAASIGAALRPTTLIVFGDPKGGTPMLQAAPTMGLVLPLRMLVYEGEEGDVRIVWPAIASLAADHGLDPEAPAVRKAADALSSLAADAAD